jgi:DNA-binding response OmpR family regulator
VQLAVLESPVEPTSADASILFVEDDAEFAQDLLAVWHPTGVVRRAASVDEAIAHMAEAATQLVLLDLCLPAQEEDGLHLLRLIRQAWGWNVPVVVLTRSASAEIRGRALSLGANAFLSKPVDVGELDRVVHDVLRRSAAPH